MQFYALILLIGLFHLPGLPSLSINPLKHQRRYDCGPRNARTSQQSLSSNSDSSTQVKVPSIRMPSFVVLTSLFLSSIIPMQSVQAFQPTSWDNNVQYEQIKPPKPLGEVPKVGEMVAIRFSGEYNGNSFDNTFQNEQPYFYRAGVGLIVKGLDDAIVHMKEGEILKLKFSGDLGFANGKPSSPGKPKIPKNAELQYVVELESLPGRGDPDALILDDI